MPARTPPTITGGRWRGRRLEVPKGLITRPTRALVRQALFDMIGPAILEARVLDLYSGSGALGLEALSRGAARVVFVEKDRRALAVLKRNLALCAPDPGSAVVLPTSAAGELDVPGAVFDLVTADPPFADVNALPALLSRPGACEPGAILAYHGPSERPSPPAPEGWSHDRSRTHGRSSWHLFQRD
jgi:16S rRNA (guanine966-N2)-methyltransferase